MRGWRLKRMLQALWITSLLCVGVRWIVTWRLNVLLAERGASSHLKPIAEAEADFRSQERRMLVEPSRASADGYVPSRDKPD